MPALVACMCELNLHARASRQCKPRKCVRATTYRPPCCGWGTTRLHVLANLIERMQVRVPPSLVQQWHTWQDAASKAIPMGGPAAVLFSKESMYHKHSMAWQGLAALLQVVAHKYIHRLCAIRNGSGHC